MKTFLRPLFLRQPSGPSRPSLFLLLLALVLRVDVRAGGFNSAAPVPAFYALSGSFREDRRRIVTLRRVETPDGPRFTLVSDTPLDDYRSYAEAERICVMIPKAVFVTSRKSESGRAFADMRVEQRDDAVMLSFRLREGATVAVNQNFNRLEVLFIANERANSSGPT